MASESEAAGESSTPISLSADCVQRSLSTGLVQLQGHDESSDPGWIELLQTLVSGNLNRIPPLSSRTVRVFISSTFSGLHFFKFTNVIGVIVIIVVVIVVVIIVIVTVIVGRGVSHVTSKKGKLQALLWSHVTGSRYKCGNFGRTKHGHPGGCTPRITRVGQEYTRSHLGYPVCKYSKGISKPLWKETPVPISDNILTNSTFAGRAEPNIVILKSPVGHWVKPGI